MAVLCAEYHVLPYRALREQTVRGPVLREVIDPVFNQVPVISLCNLPPPEICLVVCRPKAKQPLQELFLALAGQSGYAQNLPFIYIQIVSHPLYIAVTEYGLPLFPLPVAAYLHDFLPHHVIGKTVTVKFFFAVGGYQLTIPEDGHGIAHFHDLFQPVGDKQYGDSRSRNLPDARKQTLCLRNIKGTGRFIQHQQPDILVIQFPGQLHKLFLVKGQAVYKPGRVQVRPNPYQCLSGILLILLMVHIPQLRQYGPLYLYMFPVYFYVFSRAHSGKQGKLLVYHCNSFGY